MAQENINRKISIFVNGKEVENSLRGIDGAVVALRNQMRALDLSTQEGRDRLSQLSQEYNQAREVQQQYRQELGLTNATLKETGQISGGLRGALTGIFDSLVSGNLEEAKQGLTQLREGMGGLLKSTLAFISSPLGLVVTALAGLAAGAKELFDYNKEINALNSELTALGVNSKEISKVRSEILATAQTFDKDFQEIAEKANSLSQAYGISISEANKIISQGLADGGAKNKEFLDSLGEYDVFFAKAGFSAQEFTKILNTGFELGIYTDKLPDALKEADLSLKEQTKATRDALVNAFGASFSDQILAKVAGGQLTTKQALEEIAKKAKESNLSQQQYAQLTADVFKGAGEDAGGAKKIFDALTESGKRALSETAQSQLKLAEANERLNKAQAALFEIKNFGDIWTGIKTVAIDTLASILEYLSQLKKDIQPLIDLVGIVLSNSFDVLKGIAVGTFQAIGGVLKIFVDAFKIGFDVIKKIFTGDFKGAFESFKNGFISIGLTVTNTFAKIKNTIISTLQSIVENTSEILGALGLDVDKIQKKLDSWKSKIVTVQTNVTQNNQPSETTNTDQADAAALAAALEKQRQLREEARKKEEAARQKFLEKKRREEEKARQEEESRLLALAQAKAGLAKAELDLFIATNRSKLNDNKIFTQEQLLQEIARLEEIKNKQVDALNSERELKIAKAQKDLEDEKINKETFSILRLTYDTEYETARQNLELAFQADTDAKKQLYTEEQKQLQAEQLQADYELAVAEADTKQQVELLKFQKNQEDQLKILRDKKDKGIITEDEYNRFVQAQAKATTEFKRQQALQDLQTGLGALNNLANALGELFGQSKELAIASAVINGALAITSILSAASMGNPILDAVVKGVQIAATVATTAANIQKINSQKAPKKPNLKVTEGFYYGGFTGDNPNLGYDNFGAVTGYVHQNEYVIPEVMTQDPHFAPTISWLEQNRREKLKGYATGGETSTGVVVPVVPQQTQNNEMLISAVNNLNAILAAGINAKVAFGYDEIIKINDLQTDISQSTNNGIVS